MPKSHPNPRDHEWFGAKRQATERAGPERSAPSRQEILEDIATAAKTVHTRYMNGSRSSDRLDRAYEDLERALARLP